MPNAQILKTEITTSLDFLPLESLNLLAEFVAFLRGRFNQNVSSANPQLTFQDKLALIRQQLRHSGYQPRSKAAIDAQIQAERDSWET